MAGPATTTGPPAPGPQRCTLGSSWIVRMRRPALPAWPEPDLAALGATTSVRIEWMSFSFSCFWESSFRVWKSARVLGFEALQKRREADLSWTSVGAPEVE